MKLKENLVLREIAGEYMIVNPYNQSVDMTQVLSLNETAGWLWKQVEGKEFECEQLVDLLCEEYEVDRSEAEADVRDLCLEWKKNGLLA